MPKLKTHSGAKKRIKTTGSGKVLRRRAGQGHFLGKKSSARKRQHHKDYKLEGKTKQNVKQMLGKK